MDEGKHNLICLIYRVLNSCKPSTLQPVSITEKVASSSLLSVKRLELQISQAQGVNHYAMGHPKVLDLGARIPRCTMTDAAHTEMHTINQSTHKKQC